MRHLALLRAMPTMEAGIIPCAARLVSARADD